MFNIDPAHPDLFEQPISLDVWRDKYRYGNESHPFESMERVCHGVYDKTMDKKYLEEALAAMQAGLWMPAGRIQAGAGTPNRVTLINCFVSGAIPDSMEGIFDRLKEAALTQQQGGGIGMDFSTLRPKNARLVRTGTVASGPVSFMETWDAMCGTIMSAGSRRGAMMATLSCTHPDLLQFVEAKHTPGKLTNFNVSVLVTDEFMQAIENDDEWNLYFDVPPSDWNESEDSSTFSWPGDNTKYWIYSTHKARDLWDRILKSTYEYAEPGVIFIERVNQMNNLQYCEVISATNPCGEQPLPPYGACNLGAVNLARMVRKPFSDKAYFDFNLLTHTASIGVRFLDAVIHVSNFPLEQQHEEEKKKRRIGLGISGLGNALAMLNLRYGSPEAIEFTKRIMETLRDAAYEESIALAAEYGPFPLFNKELMLARPFIKTLKAEQQQRIYDFGLRNGVLLTIAPTGTTSIYYGNVSSGLEPAFMHYYKRNVRQPDGSIAEYGEVEDYAYRVFRKLYGEDTPLPDSLVTANDLTVEEHVRMQAACQEYVDASISKTINCPKSMDFEDFKAVYDLAYALGCKGCTTYRPSETRGAILEAIAEDEEEPVNQSRVRRPHVLNGSTYQLKWPHADASFYLTINHNDRGEPHEVFITSKSAKYTEWTTALTLMISAIYRKFPDDIEFVARELQQVVSSTEDAWIDGKHYNSLVHYLGHTLENHLGRLEQSPNLVLQDIEFTLDNDELNEVEYEICPRCTSPTLTHMEGCMTCLNCGHSECG